MITCYIGLGSNIANELGTPTEHIAHALAAFVASPHFAHVTASSLYQSAAFGVTDQPDFFNAVLKADTDLPPLELLDFCQNLEHRAKRQRLRHWGERSLDVDVLLYGDAIINSQRLTVPHAGLFERNFVLIPMLEIDDSLVINGQKLADVAASQDWQGLKKLTALSPKLAYEAVDKN